MIVYHLHLRTRMLPIPAFVYWCTGMVCPRAVSAGQKRRDYAENAQKKMRLVASEKRYVCPSPLFPALFASPDSFTYHATTQVDGLAKLAQRTQSTLFS